MLWGTDPHAGWPLPGRAVTHPGLESLFTATNGLLGNL
jgi:hypothetical protein